MHKAVIVASVALLWGFVALVLVGVPALALLCPEGLLSAPSWVAGVVRVVGYGAFVLWLVGTEVYLRKEAHKHD
ncbi:hypothetical protein SAMN04488056_101437 [Cohaesibacter marisflavi]|uniref:Solute:sodium symporter small subunit n=1 Tax=Cohaesibacter marisflavi TaxID=655353 RepID=A0A1I5ACU9_9HYPH|nr:hypothetical protein [Cohaesibacter marisflavi]SFN60233.1 hypothetical protein SAMN04488056_101437 [Cohaesibacter marisflavi]